MALRIRLTIAAMCAVGLSIVLFATLGIANAAAAGAAIGRLAPAFSLRNVKTGANISLDSALKGKEAVVVMFVSIQCPISNGYNGRMTSLANEYGPKGVAFVAINANQTEPVAQVAAHAQQHKFPFPVLKDTTDAVADAYGAHVTPEVYVIDSHGVLVYHGRIDNSVDETEVTTHDLSAALEDVLSGKPVAKPTAKAFGCTIKRSA
jgi:peroxiredoxin